MTPEETKRLMPVYLRMLELLAPEGSLVTFGDAFDIAARETGIRVSDSCQLELLTLAFTAITTGKVPGCADA